MTDRETIQKELSDITGIGTVRTEVPLAGETSFRVGGPADFFVMPKSEETLVRTIRYVREREIPYAVIGNGTNLLVADAGFRGVIIKIGRAYADIRVDGTSMEADAGALLVSLANRALEAGLSGLAFAGGIPGSFGGACIMNAGAYGGEMKDVLSCVRVLRSDGTVHTYQEGEYTLSYRRSSFSEQGEIVLSGTVTLREGDREEIRAQMEEFASRRKEKQPLHLASAGSTFKRPEGFFAGKLISDAGCKGMAIGDAQVSTLHAGFIVNTGHATAADIYALIEEVKKRVYENSGIMLEPEVRFLGEWS